ncbi:type II toxin-antitoxin system RelE/ParE family toxin [Shinella pollutisoli]|uniref:Toxin n=1 Tax=Shinella pollutisoli TaxID=2250594 RepID=A0ABV7DMZ3_9HYPH
MTYRLSREADEDIVRLYVEGARLFGHAQAESYHQELKSLFELLAANPRMARERSEIVPPVRIHPYKAHLIVYVVDANDDILIVRIRHGHEDWSERAQ